jgi:hypothetical protein
MRIKSLELRAKVVVEGLWKGMHRSPYHGFSVEFSEYRAYVQGDDPRYIDWKVLARSDRTYIKKFEDETNLRCQLVIDHSKSMKYGSQSFTKADYAATLAATLASFLMKQGDAAGLTTFADGIEDLALSTVGCKLIGDDRLGPTVPPQGFAEELQCCSLVAGRRDDAFWSVALVVDRPLRWRFNRLIVTRTSSRCQRR